MFCKRLLFLVLHNRNYVYKTFFNIEITISSSTLARFKSTTKSKKILKKKNKFQSFHTFKCLLMTSKHQTLAQRWHIVGNRLLFTGYGIQPYLPSKIFICAHLPTRLSRSTFSILTGLYIQIHLHK